MSEIKHLDLGPARDYQPTPAAEADTAVADTLSYKSSTAPAASSSMARKSPAPIIVLVIAVVAGILTGGGAQRLFAKSGGNPLSNSGPAPIAEIATGNVKNGDVFGKADEKTFKDSAEGYLEKNTTDVAEGTHRLVRAGGESQTVYLTSSVTDLDKFDGMNVKIWGETFKGQKVGWLMDVGRVQVLSTQGTAPTEE